MCNLSAEKGRGGGGGGVGGGGGGCCMRMSLACTNLYHSAKYCRKPAIDLSVRARLIVNRPAHMIIMRRVCIV